MTVFRASIILIIAILTVLRFSVIPKIKGIIFSMGFLGYRIIFALLQFLQGEGMRGLEIQFLLQIREAVSEYQA